MPVSGPLKYHGGKAYLAKKIIALMVPHLHFVEPFFGGGAVLLAKDPEGVSEVVNDLNGHLMNFWKVLQNTDYFAQFRRIIEAVPFAEKEYDYATHYDKNDMPRLNMPRVVTNAEVVGKAVNFFIACRQSLSGRMRGFGTVVRTRTRRGMNDNVSAWLTAVEGLPAVHERLKRVLILNRDAMDVIKGQDGPDTLFYCDPPYLHETRTTTGEYAFEMSDEGHHNLLCLLKRCKGKVLLSGYRSPMYDNLLKDWRRKDFDLPNQAAGGKTKRRMTECVWMNY